MSRASVRPARQPTVTDRPEPESVVVVVSDGGYSTTVTATLGPGLKRLASRIKVDGRAGDLPIPCLYPDLCEQPEIPGIVPQSGELGNLAEGVDISVTR